jgi:NAD(P)-dependent dehydrogenase (short-subunit alcohol dehydrogenase family)
MDDLGGKTAVITGGASGIGRALAERFAAEQMRLVLADIDADALDQAVVELRSTGVEAVGVPTDVTVAADVRSLATEALEAFGAVHLVCNNAGVAPLRPMLEMDIDTWRWLFEVNVMGVVHGVAVFTPLLVEQGIGHVVNTASVAGLIATPGLGAYSATKHAVVGLSESLWHELDGTGVGVSVVCPSIVRTRIFDSERARPERWGGPEEWGEHKDRYRSVVEAVGTPPEAVADAAARAVVEDRLWVLTHDEVKPAIASRTQGVLDGTNPTPMPSLA